MLSPGLRHVEHNIYKSDVFSAGLVLFQLATLKDVLGFNQKTTYTDGEKLIKDGLKSLSKRYSIKVINILDKMLTFVEDKRPNFVELGKLIFGENYQPKIHRNWEKSTNFASSSNNLKLKDQSNEIKKEMFRQYVVKQKLNFNTNKTTFWFEYGGNIIGKYYIDKDDSKWKLIGKYTNNEFPSHYVTVFVDHNSGYFLIGGIDSSNTYQFKDGEIRLKASLNFERSFTSAININGAILAIGGYEYNEKSQLKSIEVYDVEKDKWTLNVFEDLKVARSQASAVLFNNKTVLVFGGYNKSFGTLSSIEKISLNDKKTELLEFKLPIPLRRFNSLKISDTRIMIMGGVTRLCKDSDFVYCLDYEKKSFRKFTSLPKGGILDHELVLDEIGNVHLFFENNYGTSPPIHHTYNYLDFN